MIILMMNRRITTTIVVITWKKKRQKKVDRALRTKDISALLEDEEDVTGFEINYSTFEEDNL